MKTKIKKCNIVKDSKEETKKKHYYRVAIIIVLLLYSINPIFSVFTSYKMCDFYFKKEFAQLNSTFIIFLLIYIGTFLYTYNRLIASYKTIYNSNIDLNISIIRFISFFLISILLFTEVFITILVITKEGFAGIDLSSSLSIYVDLLLFTIQNFVFQNIINITPVTPIVKIVVIIEILYFTIFVSLVVFNLFNLRNNIKSKV